MEQQQYYGAGYAICNLGGNKWAICNIGAYGKCFNPTPCKQCLHYSVGSARRT